VGCGGREKGRTEVGSEERQQIILDHLEVLVREMTTIRRILALHFEESWALPESRWRADLRGRQAKRAASVQAPGREA
jgi:hypothetical protein